MSVIEKLNSISLGAFSLMDLMYTVLLVIFCVLARRALAGMFSRALDKSRLDGSIKGFLKAATSAVLWVIVILIIADRLGIPITSLVALVSVAGLALSLSVQNILTNLFSGMTILGTRPFGAGDYVDIGGTAGTVLNVGLFYTVLRTPDGRDIHIPNSTVAGTKVDNYSANPTRRIDLEVGASYDDSTVAVKRALLAAIEMTEGVVEEPAPFISITRYDDSSIIYIVQVWVKSSGFLASKFALVEHIRDAFESEGVRMTYNHINVHMV